MTKPLAGKVALVTGTGRRCQKYPAPVQLQTLRYKLQHVLGDFMTLSAERSKLSSCNAIRSGLLLISRERVQISFVDHRIGREVAMTDDQHLECGDHRLQQGLLLIRKGFSPLIRNHQSPSASWHAEISDDRLGLCI